MKRNGPHRQLFVRALSAASTRGIVCFGAWVFPCALGRSGRRARKREGDGATPIGALALQTVFYRPDQGPRPLARLPLKRLSPHDGWCDDVQDRNYNRQVRHPYPASAEALWREDGLYDVVVVLDHNLRPRVRCRGSAIFLHVARPGFSPTEGCVAMRRGDLLKLLARVRRGDRLRI